MSGDFEPIWRIEGRNAAIAHGYYVCSVNRLGTEIYEHEYEKDNGETVIHKGSGHFFGSSYISAPDGTRTPVRWSIYVFYFLVTFLISFLLVSSPSQ